MKRVRAAGYTSPHGCLNYNPREQIPAILKAMKIATYNVNGINGRLPVLLQWLNDSRPDIACLQELKAPQDKFPAAALSKIGYSAIWHGQSQWNGVC